jgi:glycosyltransferase involved in cell wall biosynthesis
MAERAPSVLHLSLSDLQGGAARAAYRTHRALLAAGYPSRMLVRRKVSDDPTVETVDPLRPWESRRRRIARRLPFRRRLPEATTTFNYDDVQDFDEASLLRRVGEVDVVCLQRITRFLTVRQIRKLYERHDGPLAWVVHDQSPVTGGCHFSYDCDGYMRTCGRCPQLRSSDANDLTHTIWQRKRHDLAELPLTFIAQSNEAARWVRQSSLFSEHPVERIGMPIDGEIFRPLDRSVARTVLQVPLDRKVVMVGAADLGAARKGADHAVSALQGLRKDVFVLAVGSGGEEFLRKIPQPGRATGRLSDDVALALAFQAADVFLSPSIADAGPMMVAESLLCGTPVVAFDVGCASDLVTSPEIGFRPPPGDVAGLAAGLAAVLQADGGDSVTSACRDAGAPWEAKRVAAAHAELYRRLVAP